MESTATVARQGLGSFEDAQGLGSDDREFVNDLVAVLEKHGNLDRFGLCLLHDHFSVAEDEVLVETNDPEARTLHVSVEKARESGHTKPSQWRFLPDVPSSRRGEFADDGGRVEVLMKCTIKCD
jgi:hypothetical protein